MSQNVSENYSLNDVIDIDELRKEYIRLLDKSLSESEIANVSNDLFSLGLTVYSNNNTLDSLIYNSLAASTLDRNISLYPEQLKVVDEIKNQEALIISAPTSFGKTFCIFEYIAKYLPKNVVLIVPTLALVDEYLKKIISKYKNVFSNYKKYINIDIDTKIDYEQNNLFILTHDKVVENNSYNLIKKIDFLVIDEVYKLKREENNDRVLILNLAYYYLSKIAEKYVLLAPFISDVEDRDKLIKAPKLFKTNFSPVVNELKTINVDNDNNKLNHINKILKEHEFEKTLIYFPTVTEIPAFVNNNIVPNYEKIDINDKIISNFVNWIKEEIHEEWYVVKAMERGFLVHNGQLLNNGFRMYQLDMYEKSKQYYRLLCTSTILEGVNLSAKNIIITSPSRNRSKFDAFDFYNLVGRTGRLYQHYLGYAFYLKESDDPVYAIEDAIKTIKFEATDLSEDFEFHTKEDAECEQYKLFLEKLNITSDEYKINIGAKFKIKRISETYDKYLELKEEFINELKLLQLNEVRSRGLLIELLYRIINYSDTNRPFVIKLNSFLINKLINKNRLRIRTIINSTIEQKIYNNTDINYIISTTLRLKSSYIEHEFYGMCKIITYFMKCDGIDASLISIVNDKVLSCIDYVYFSNSKCRKTLKDLGIYEYDIDKIINVIGENLENVNDIYDALKNNKFNNLNFISEYIIDRL